MAKAAAMLPQIALCAKKKAWHSGDVPRRKLNRENDVRGTLRIFKFENTFFQKVWRMAALAAHMAFMLLGQKRLEAI